MAFGKASSRTPEAAERRAEGRLLNALKGALREAVAAFQDREKLTQSQAADRLGCDAGFLSRTLNPDFHVNSRTLAQIMHRAGGEWVISWCPASGSGCQAHSPGPRFDGAPAILEVASSTSDSALSSGYFDPRGKARRVEAVNGTAVNVKEVSVSGLKSNRATARLLAA